VGIAPADQFTIHKGSIFEKNEGQQSTIMVTLLLTHLKVYMSALYQLFVESSRLITKRLTRLILVSNLGSIYAKITYPFTSRENNGITIIHPTHQNTRRFRLHNWEE
jgi:hypothetical protein